MSKKHGPWEILSTEMKYQNPWLKVREDQVIQPDGSPGIFGVVEMKSGVSVLPVGENGEVYLTKEFHYALGRFSVEVASGGVDAGESPEQAAARELQEELGITASDWVNLGRTDPFTTAIHSPSWLYLVRGLSFGNPNQDATEQIEMVEIPFKEAVEMAMDGTITHSPSALLVLKAWYFLKEK